MQILPVWFIYIAAAMRVTSGMAYFRATIRGTARPHGISWLIWSATPFITLFAALAEGVRSPILVVTFALGLSPLLVFIAAASKGRRLLHVDAFDVVCILIALAGIVLWAATQSPILAIILAIAADTISCLPTIRKTIRDPASEYPPTYLLSASSMILAILATIEISFAAFAFPVYILIMNLIIGGLASRQYQQKYRRKRKRRR